MEETALYLFFKNLGMGWVNAATVISALFGIAFSLFAFWFSKKLNDESSELIMEIKKVADGINKNADLANKNTRILRLDNLRVLYELTRDTDSHLYWRFRWRFEMFDCLRILVYEKNGETKKIIGYCEILIQGFSNPSESAGFERKDSEFYKVKIREIDAEAGNTFPFQASEVAACFCANDSMMISKGIDPWTEEPKFIFEIAGLGHHRFSHGEPSIEDVKIYTRIKDT